MGRKLDLTGQRFGKLMAVRFVGMKNDRSVWLFKCDCGNLKEALAKEVNRGKLSSCGCYRGGETRLKSIHGDGSKKNEHPLHKFWRYMRKRCNNKNHDSYNNYGGRGITYDSNWDNYENFKEDMYFKYIYATKKYGKNTQLSIERRNANGNYCFKNCKFILLNEQQGNTRVQKWFVAISPDKKEYVAKNVAKFSRKYNLNPSHVGECLRQESIHHKKWTFEYIKEIKKHNLKVETKRLKLCYQKK